MNLLETLAQEHSKANTTKIVAYIGKNTARFAELMDLFLHSDYRTVQRAAWAVNYCGENHPEMITPYFGKMLENLRKENIHDAVKRNTVRLWQFVEIPHEYEGEVVDICFEYLKNAQSPVAVKIFSMSVLEKIIKKYPELSQELLFLIEDQLPYQTAGFKHRGKRILEVLK